MPFSLSSAMRRLHTLTERTLAAFLLFCCPAAVLAGGGPEGVLVVVNPQSQSSMTIANHYIRLREIPPDNVLYLPWEPALQMTDVDTFRRRILMPVLQVIDGRRLFEQIDYVVYSSDFPWGIALNSDIRKVSRAARPTEPPGGESGAGPNPGKLPARSKWPKQLTPVGSLNGMTYLWQMSATGHPAYFEMHSNRYARPMLPKQNVPPSAGFRSDRQYNVQGEVVAARGRRYFLSTMLGVTAGRGNTPDEVVSYLQHGAATDATHPKGTIYFVANTDIRSKVRDHFFPAVIEELQKLGVAASLFKGKVPLNKDDVQGLVMGRAAFDWKTSESKILPGAICDNFTSFGGVMTIGGSQTPLTEFLRYGAAGACGTVTEPYAIAAKFPSPMLQLHYVRGCSLAEAFYQSVLCPYQLLIVGDPLCQPWASPPQVTVAGVEPGAVVRGTVTLKPSATVPGGNDVASFRLYVDGLRVADCRPDETFPLDTTKLPDGYHELRLVAVGPAPIESQGRRVVPIRTDNHGRTIEVSVATKGALHANQPVAITVRSPASVGIIVAEGSRIVGRLASQEGEIEIPGKTLGAGPVQLRVIGLGEGGSLTNVIAPPLPLELDAN